MAIVKEYRCAAHGEFDAVKAYCKHCGHGKLVVREIRTAPAYRRKNMKFIDQTLRGIAQDHGLTDMKNDAKAGVSVLQAMQKSNDITTPRWVGVDHAAPGFSKDKNARVPTVTAESMGFVPTPAATMKMPPLRTRTQVVGRYNGD